MVKGGFSQIIDGLASELDIRLNTAVTDISYETEDCIQITTTEGDDEALLFTGGERITFLRFMFWCQ